MAAIQFPFSHSPAPDTRRVREHLELVPDLRPPLQEDVFDPGEIYNASGSLVVGREEIDWRLRVPEHLAYAGLAVVVPGFMGIHGSSSEPAKALAAQGIPTATYKPARKGISWYETVARPQVLHAKSVHEVGKAIMDSSEIARFAPNLNNIDFERRLLIAHSMGGLGATLYAKKHPQIVEGIFHEASCGFGHPKLHEIAQDVPRQAHLGLWHELVPSLLRGHIVPGRENIRDLVDYIFTFRTLLEANSCLRHDAREDTASLREDHNVFVAYQAYEHDILVRPDEDVAPHVDHFEIMANAGHLAPIRKARKVAARAAAVMLERD